MCQEVCWSAQVRITSDSHCNCNHWFIELLIVIYYSPWSICLLYWPDKILQGTRAGNNHPCIFHVLDDDTNFCSSSRMWYCIWATVFLGWDNTKGFHLAFTTTIGLIPQIREPVWEFWQPLSVSISVINSGTREINTGWVQRHTSKLH